MKYYKKIAAAVLCLATAFSAVSPVYSAFADNEDDEETAVSYDDEVMPIDLGDDAVAISLDDESLEDTAETDIASDEDQVFVVGDFSYTVDNDGNAVITDCSSTENELVIPEMLGDAPVAEITAAAFLEKHYTKIHIPSSVTYISAENPFASLMSLKEITVDEDNENYKAVDGVLYSKDMKTLICYPASKEGKSFTIPDGVEELGIAAVSSTRLTEIKLPSSLKVLNRHCFSFNELLEAIDMSGTAIEEIPIMAFANCVSLTDVKFSNSTTYLYLACFINCYTLSEIELPPAVTYIGQSAFQGTSVMKVVIPNTVSKIDYNAFGYDENQNIIPEFTIIGEMGSAAQTYASDYDTEYGYQNNFNFMSMDLYERQLEYEKLGVIASGDFEYAIIDGEGCLVNCVSIEDTVTVPSEIDGVTITSIYFGAFQSCGSATIILPETVKKIGEEAFSTITQNITIPGGCTEIEGDEPFISCISLKSITVTEGDGAFSSKDGVLYNKEQTKLIAYPQKKEDEEFTAPSTLKEIALSALCYNEYLKKADISTVENIGNYAFEGCLSLEDVKLSKDLKVVGVNAFLGCEAMSSIRIYDKVETIGDYAFGFTYDEELAKDIEANAEAYAIQQGESVIMPYSVMDGFKIYTEKDSLAYQYAKACNIEVITGTVAIGGANIQRNFLYAVGGGLLAVLLVIIGVFTGKNIKKKKQTKASVERKAKAEEKKKSAENNENDKSENPDTEENSDED